MDNPNTMAMSSMAVNGACDVPEAQHVARVLLERGQLGKPETPCSWATTSSISPCRSRGTMLGSPLEACFSSFITTIFCKERHVQNPKITILHTVDMLTVDQSSDEVITIGKDG
ncbi:hypothetical protein llap_11788 [Limosa lapponica baueri]|uniref:Uncharacterized protein n=1 Tax=Limosa lapponica baueri TaxID=1758121 RepID=A0A2I0TVS9_LIMLA|nr:hypothetical protein llap_11788 [Limosa lapponica baueri]